MKGIHNWKEQIVSSKHKFMGDQIAFKEAPEPTNILWENRDVTA